MGQTPEEQLKEIIFFYIQDYEPCRQDEITLDIRKLYIQCNETDPNIPKIRECLDNLVKEEKITTSDRNNPFNSRRIFEIKN